MNQSPTYKEENCNNCKGRVTQPVSGMLSLVAMGLLVGGILFFVLKKAPTLE